MRMIAIAAAIAALCGVGAWFVLNDKVQQTAYQAFSTGGARVGDPGDNLVGRDWPSVYRADHRS